MWDAKDGVFFPPLVGSGARNTLLVSCSSYLARAPTPACSAFEMSDRQKLSQGPAVALVASNIFYTWDSQEHSLAFS